MTRFYNSVRSGTLPPGHVIARVALPPGPAGSSNAQVHILSNSLCSRARDVKTGFCILYYVHFDDSVEALYRVLRALNDLISRLE
jgi:hypothetical protein